MAERERGGSRVEEILGKEKEENELGKKKERLLWEKEIWQK